MKKSDFHYDLPPELIAQEPLAERSSSRLLCVDGVRGTIEDDWFRNLPERLVAGDLLVFNDTRVMPARLHARKDSGGQVEILLERVSGTHRAHAQVKASKPLKPGRALLLDDGTRVEVLARDGVFYDLHFDTQEPLEKLLQRIGHVPLPPYITRTDTAHDRIRYQTLFARHWGAVAAPTAGLHFDQQLLERLRARGVEAGCLTLHVGSGTFAPLRCDDVHAHTMHEEWLNVGAELVQQVQATRRRGNRVVAVGTTVVRALEAASASGTLQPHAGATRIYIFPGYRFRSVDALITNFHQPESTLLMLVSAFAGRELVLRSYQHAVRERYRFFSYGDAMWLQPASGACNEV